MCKCDSAGGASFRGMAVMKVRVMVTGDVNLGHPALRGALRQATGTGRGVRPEFGLVRSMQEVPVRDG